MTKRSHIVALAAVFALTSLSVMVAAQQQPYRIGAPDGPAGVHGAAVNGASAQNAPSRSNDRQVGQLLTRTKKSAERFAAASIRPSIAARLTVREKRTASTSPSRISPRRRTT